MDKQTKAIKAQNEQAANIEAARAKQQEKKRQNVQMRKTKAAMNTAAVNRTRSVCGKAWAKLFTKSPDRSYTCVRTRTLTKGKQGTSAEHAYAHNLRTMPTNPDHIDPAQSHQNCLVFQRKNADKSPTLPEDILKQYRDRGLLSTRTQAEAVELLFSMSPAVWEAAKPEHKPDLVQAFGTEVHEFVKQGRFEKGRLLQVVVHADEPDASPTCKVVFLPLTPACIRGKKGEGEKPWVKHETDPATGRKAYNEDGTPKMGRVVEVSKRAYGLKTGNDLSALQTEFANHLRRKGWEVQRGRVMEPENHQKHKSTKAWRAGIEAEGQALLDDYRQQGEAKMRELIEEAQRLGDERYAEALAKARDLEQMATQTMAEIEKMRNDIVDAMVILEEYADRELVRVGATKAQIENDRARRSASNQKALEQVEANTGGAVPSRWVSREVKDRMERKAKLENTTQQIAEGLKNPTKGGKPKSASHLTNRNTVP